MSDSVNGQWSLYDTTTGLFVGRTLQCPRAHLPHNLPAGHGAIDGLHDHQSKRVDLEAVERDRAAALSKHHESVEAARAAFVPRVDIDGHMTAFREPPFEFHATPAHLVDYVPPEPSAADLAAAQRATARAAAFERIQFLERQQLRPLRELGLGIAGAKERLQVIEQEIEALRTQLA